MKLFIDREISNNNSENKIKRESGRLGCLEINLVGCEVEEKYKKHQIEKGQREGQYKMVTLQYKHEEDFPFHEYLVERSEIHA